MQWLINGAKGLGLGLVFLCAYITAFNIIIIFTPLFAFGALFRLTDWGCLPRLWVGAIRLEFLGSH